MSKEILMKCRIKYNEDCLPSNSFEELEPADELLNLFRPQTASYKNKNAEQQTQHLYFMTLATKNR